MNYIPYQVDLLNMIRKMDNHVGSIPIQDGREIQIYHYRNLEIDTHLNIKITNKKVPPDFDNFALYKKFLIEKLEDIHINANLPDRKITYSPISMMSAGYDSPACTVLGMHIGLKEVMTFRTARSEKGVAENTDDSGKKIAEILGLQCKEYNRLEVLQKKGLPEAEFVASGDLGQDFGISILENDLTQRLLIVGYHGDKVWDAKAKHVKKDIIRSEAGGCSLVDFKFRVGYIFVPLPFVGCLSHPSIHKISTSKEMHPWRMRNRYDRPIARRIIEEMGVGRNLFGQKKKAISILLNRHKRNTLFSRMNPESAKSFERFYQENKDKRNRIKQSYYNIMHRLYFLHHYIFSKPNQIFSRLHLPFKIPCPVPDKFSQSPGRPSFLVHWGISIIENRYKT